MAQQKRLSKEERREQILKAALKVFTEKGYRGSTTIDIAKKAQISEVTLFRYFSSKKQIFMQSIEPVLLADFKESIKESKNLKPEKNLEHIFKNRMKFVSENQEVIKLILMESQVNPEVASFNFVGQMTDLLKKSIKEAGIAIKDEDFSVRLIAGSILSFLYLPRPSDAKIDAHVKKLINIITG